MARRTSRVSIELGVQALYPYWKSIIGDSHSVFVETFQVQVQAWKVAKHVYVAEESSVCNVAISAERIRGAVSHIGVL
ncbi:hypothetical protein PIB30_086663 [Stylosanthes scabra]|uniref:Uncharacterized protein n=1 Tax=Stylosanthes scabra TaxID=79078 RepID=A0ABU6RUH3_9FABA|nr:hypothetical protein [Stylosanthes scabra]